MRKIISEKWLRENYLEKNLTRDILAEKRKVKVHVIDTLIRKYGLEKWRHGITHKVYNPAPRTNKQNLLVQKNQPHRKMVEQWDFKGVRLIAVFNSINDAAIKLGLMREHIRDCLNPNKKRYRTGGFMFKEHEVSRKQDKKFLTRKYNYKLKQIFQGVA